MGTLFLRTGSLTLGTTKINFANAGGSAEGSTLAVEFRVKKDLKPEPNNVEIKVWNLAPETRKALETPKSIPVQLDVGYAGDNHTIYLGELRSAHSEVDGPNIITSISSGDSELAFTGNRALFQVPKAASAAQILQLTQKALSVGKGNLDAVVALATTGGPARTYHGNAATVFGQTVRANGMEWSIQDGAVQVMPIGSSVGSSGDAVVLTADSGMVGSPTVDNKGIVTVKSLIQPGLFPGMPVVIKGVLLQGTYRIETAEFAGATWGADWTVMIHGKKWG